MNKLTIIGNLTRDPELRTTSTGCERVFLHRGGEPPPAFPGRGGPARGGFLPCESAWRQLGEICQKYLAKGRKVAVVGPVTVRSYTANDGSTRFSLEVTADDVEFLSSPFRGCRGLCARRSRSTCRRPPRPTRDLREVDDEDLPF